MTNPSKKKGTGFETACVRTLRGVTGDNRIERRALHGSFDLGDLYGIFAHGFSCIAECKCHARVTPSLLESWKGQALRERENAGADVVALIVDESGRPVGRSRVYLTDRDMLRSCYGIDPERGDELDRHWSMKTLDEWARMLGGNPA